MKKIAIIAVLGIAIVLGGKHIYSNGQNQLAQTSGAISGATTVAVPSSNLRAGQAMAFSVQGTIAFNAYTVSIAPVSGGAETTILTIPRFSRSVSSFNGGTATIPASTPSGTYTLKFTGTNGAGTTLVTATTQITVGTVTTPPTVPTPKVTLTSQSANSTTKIGGQISVAWTYTNAPQNGYLRVYLDGPSRHMLLDRSVTNLASLTSLNNVTIPTQAGFLETGGGFLPGDYRVKVELFNGMPCNDIAGCSTQGTQLLAQSQSMGILTLIKAGTTPVTPPTTPTTPPTTPTTPPTTPTGGTTADPTVSVQAINGSRHSFRLTWSGLPDGSRICFGGTNAYATNNPVVKIEDRNPAISSGPCDLWTGGVNVQGSSGTRDFYMYLNTARPIIDARFFVNPIKGNFLKKSVEFKFSLYRGLNFQKELSRISLDAYPLDGVYGDVIDPAKVTLGATTVKAGERVRVYIPKPAAGPVPYAPVTQQNGSNMVRFPNYMYPRSIRWNDWGAIAGTYSAGQTGVDYSKLESEGYVSVLIPTSLFSAGAANLTSLEAPFIINVAPYYVITPKITITK